MYLSTVTTEEKLDMVKKSPSMKELINKYDEWASSYDRDLCSVYGADRPKAAYRLVLEYFKENSDIRILDIAAGTGMVGQGLQHLGYNNIDALDASRAMLDVAKTKNIYKNIICCMMGNGKNVELPDESYDCLVAVGGIGMTGMNEDVLPEMIRLTKTGGLIIIVTCENYFTESDNLDNLEPTMLKYSLAANWRWLLRRSEDNYMQGMRGVSYVFQKQKNLD